MEKEEGPIANTETGKIKVKAKVEKQPDNNETVGNVTTVKAKMKMKPEIMDKESITKVDLATPPKVEVGEPVENPQALEEITNNQPVKVDDVVAEVKETIVESIQTGKLLPENVQKLVDFMSETGGDINDYVALAVDYDKLDNQDLLLEYYKTTKPHLNNDEINFLLEDNFAYDEDVDSEKDIKRKKLALKEQVANAKSHLDGIKSKYYEDIKAGSKLTSEQQKAIDFFNRHNKEEVENKKGNDQRVSVFQEKTKGVFNNEFKGFEYNIGEKKFRYNVQDAEKVRDNQSDISNFIGKFLDENNTMRDAEGYHKSLFTAMNPDAIAKHFYEQGQADALRDSVAKGKNISMDPRQTHGEVVAGGIRVRALGENSTDFKFKIKNKNK
jgi:hypothetical protein